MLDNAIKELKIDQKVPCIYIHLYNKIESRESKYLKDVPFDINIIERDKVVLLFLRNGVPSKLHAKVFNEMQHFGLIKIRDKKRIEVVKD